MNRTNRVLGWLGLTMAFMTATGCAMNPVNDENVGSSHRAYFSGYASREGAAIRIEAQRPSDGAWLQIGYETRASRRPESVLDFDPEIYFWSDSVTIPPEFWSRGRANVRAMQLEHDPIRWVPVFHYDQAGKQCIIDDLEDQMNGGHDTLDPHVAGVKCSKNDAGTAPRNFITVRDR